MAGLIAQHATLPAGGGAYVLSDVTVGVFLNDQPDHRLTVGGDRHRDAPLSRHQGWILPAGAEGLCLFDTPLEVTTVSVPAALLSGAGLDEPPQRIAPVVGSLDPLLVQMALQAEQFASGGTLYAQTMAHAFAAHMAQVLRPRAPDAVVIDDKRLRGAVDHIRAHLADDLSMEDLAGVAAMSASHFARAFKRATGTSPLQFVIAERMEAALALLRTTSLTVADVAYRVGYRDVPRFGQHFRRRFGVTPAAARE